MFLICFVKLLHLHDPLRRSHCAILGTSYAAFLLSYAAFLQSCAAFLQSYATFLPSYAVFLLSDAAVVPSYAAFLLSFVVFYLSYAVFLPSYARLCSHMQFCVLMCGGSCYCTNWSIEFALIKQFDLSILNLFYNEMCDLQMTCIHVYCALKSRTNVMHTQCTFVCFCCFNVLHPLSNSKSNLIFNMDFIFF